MIEAFTLQSNPFFFKKIIVPHLRESIINIIKQLIKSALGNMAFFDVGNKMSDHWFKRVTFCLFCVLCFLLLLMLLQDHSPNFVWKDIWWDCPWLSWEYRPSVFRLKESNAIKRVHLSGQNWQGDYSRPRPLCFANQSGYHMLVYTKPVNIHFRTLWLATQARDILHYPMVCKTQ